MKIDTNNLLNKKILLTTLESPFLDDQYVFPYLGVLYLMSIAHKVGADVTFTDKLSLFDVVDYDVVAISCMTPQGEQAYQICRFIKKIHPHITVVIGGPHATNYLDECLKEPFDIIVVGDGERIWEKLLTGEIGGQRVLCDNLTESEMNSYPVPYREKSYIDRYNYYLNGVKATTLVNSRGCPMRCAFCESAKTKPKWFSLEHFEKEIKSIVDLGIRGVMIFDDLFAVTPNKTKPYLEVLKRESLIFRCFGHAKLMTKHPEMAALLRKSGCIEIGFGAESASQKILDTIFKGTKVEDMHNFVEIVIQAGIKVKAFFIIGLPGETEETARATSEFIKKYRAKYPELFDFDLTVFFPYKGTQIGDSVRNGGGFDIRPRRGMSWSEIDSNGYGAYKKKKGDADMVVETNGLTAERIGELQKETLLCRR